MPAWLPKTVECLDQTQSFDASGRVNSQARFFLSTSRASDGRSSPVRARDIPQGSFITSCPLTSLPSRAEYCLSKARPQQLRQPSCRSLSNTDHVYELRRESNDRKARRRSTQVRPVDRAMGCSQGRWDCRDSVMRCSHCFGRLRLFAGSLSR